MRALQAAHERHPEIPTRPLTVNDVNPAAQRPLEEQVGTWAVPIPGLTSAMNAATVRRHGLRNDPLGGSRLSPESDRVAGGVLRVLQRRSAGQRDGALPSASERDDSTAVRRRPPTLPISRLRRPAGGEPRAPLVAGSDVLVSGSPARGTIRRAGDKIAFEAKQPPTKGDEPLIARIEKAIKVHQDRKRKYKDHIEQIKDQEIKKVSDQEAANIRKIPSDQNPDYKQQRADIQDPAKAAKAEILHQFQKDYAKSGWHLVELKKEILEATGNQVTFGREARNEIPILNLNGQQLYSILLKGRRFEAPVAREDGKALDNPAFKKKGTEKQYVEDSRGLAIGRFVYRGCDSKQMKALFREGTIKPRNDTDVIGKQFDTFDFGKSSTGTPRTALDTITQKEREFLQQRDGSEDDQRMLSVTHAKPNRKVFSNHGAEFTSTATIKIDLAKVKKELISNLHLDESKDFKTSLPRKDRTANEVREMELYVYSAQKNRETLLRAVPVDAVVEVKIAGQGAMTPYQAKRVYNTEFDKLESANERKQREEAEAKKQAEIAAAQKSSAQSAEQKRYGKIKTALEEQAARNSKKLRGDKVKLAMLWGDLETYVGMHEEKIGKSLDPGLIFLTDLQALLKLVE